mmetsp:Transcript_19/g.51  ORF Transcript_19/g.51 Transcript_19/m.51 type:complete len:208 (-) Transcript_19:234-857(-)
MLLLTLALTATGAFDFGRFVRTSWFFQNPMARSRQAYASKVIYPAPGTVFGPLDDVIMGGSSQSAWREDGSGATWSGNMVSQSGGFCGARCRAFDPPVDASAYVGVRVDVACEEPLRFKFIVRDSADWNGVAWTWSFDVDKRTVVELPFEDAVPTKFARTLKDTKPLDASSLSTFQFVFSKFEYDDALNPTFREGPFALQVFRIELF